jgi:PAS domain S-box-containing protein
VSARLRQFGPVGVVLVLTAVGFFVTRAHSESNARHDSSHRADIAATRVRDQVAQASTLVDGVRRFLAGPNGSSTTAAQFADIGARWLGPVGLPAAAWIEQVPAKRRAGYERRTGRPIVVPTPSGGIRSAGPRSHYLPATLVSGTPPFTSPGLDLGSIPGLAAAVARPQTAYGVSATPLARLPDGTTGLFLVQSAQRLSGGVVEPGFVVLFLPASWLLAGATDTGGSYSGVQVAVGGASAGDLGNGPTAESSFAADGQPFVVRVPQSAVHGAAAVQPWLVGGAGLMLAVLAGALRVIAARRAKAKAELDRLFAITPDAIVVAGFDGYFKRVNPAFQTLLGYSETELLARPYVDFIHPEDRERTLAERAKLREGETTDPIVNRYVCKDGSDRWIEWTATPVHEERLSFAVGRDVTERRQTLAEQAALRRVATLVAEAVSPSEVFASAAAEIRQLLGSDYASLGRYEPDGTLTNLAHDDGGDPDASVPVVGTRVRVEGGSATGVVLRTGRAARMSLETATGPVADLARSLGVLASVGAPIVVEGRLWGVIVVSTKGEPLPADTERRLADFTELVATGIADAQSRAALGRLADQQAALRRVATLVAERVAPAGVFAAIADEVSHLLDAEASTIGRLEADGTVSVVAISGTAGDASVLGTQFQPDPDTVIAAVVSTGRSTRKDDYDPASEPTRRLGIRSGVGVPIVVEGALWGIVAIGTVRERFPEDTERRLEEFTALAATAIANAESRSALAHLADQQAALRRVATLVAEGVDPAEVLAAVGDEASGLLNAYSATIARIEQNGTFSVVANSGAATEVLAVGTRHTPEPGWVVNSVIETGRSVRRDNDAVVPEGIPRVIQNLGVRSTVAAPIIVEGALWGVMILGTQRERFPDGTEERLEEFTALAATAIANADGRSELAASRARIVTASDETRRRIERDLHDGTQQRLVSIGFGLRMAEAAVPEELEEARRTLADVAGEVNAVIDELREISRGIHPAVLSEGGLGPALRTLARRSATQVELHSVVEERLPQPVEVAGYYVVSEALTNAAKHANASRVEVDAAVRGNDLQLSIRDDGVGGANPAIGSGLIGLRDRVEALGGSIEITSLAGEGTHVFVQLPLNLDLASDESGEPRPDRIPAGR